MKQIALEKLIKGHQEIFGDLFLNLEQQEKLTKLYDECFELQKQQSLELIELTTQLKSVSTANWKIAEIECINIYNHYYNDIIIPKEEPKQDMKQTAVEWLYNEISEIIGKVPFSKEQEEKLIHTLEKAKEMEKQQIIDAYKDGVVGTKLAEEYYNETFNGQNT